MNRRFVGTVAAATLALAALAGCGDDTDTTAAPAETGEVVISDGWVRATEGTDDPTMTAAFMQIKNETDGQVTLVGGSTEVAGMTEIHEMVMKDGAMVMQKIEGGLEIPAGELVVLQPGGNHVMLMDMQQDLAAGDEVELTLEFADGESETVTLPVKEFTEEEGHYHETPGSTESPMSPMSPSDSMSPTM